MLNNRQEDLSKVFDRTWTANHNDVAKRGREKEKKFMNELYNTQNKQSEVKPLTQGQRVENLHNNMNNVFSGQKQASLNNIIKKWK